MLHLFQNNSKDTGVTDRVSDGEVEDFFREAVEGQDPVWACKLGKNSEF